MVFELADNALKALYLHVFYKYAIAETVLGDLPYDAWLKVFRDEIETNSARTFERICQQKSLAVVVRLTLLDDAPRITSSGLLTQRILMQPTQKNQVLAGR